MSLRELRKDGQHGHERGNGSLSITVYPYKLTQRELEARLEPGLTVLPGQYVRFATAEPIFGQVREVRALPPASPGLLDGYRLIIDLLYGTPSLHPQQVILMNAAQMGHEIQRLQEPIAQPLQLSPDFRAELVRLGALTVVGGDDFVQKYEALQLLIRAIQPYRRLVILDPLGVFVEEDGFALWQAGRDVRLSLQAVGSKSFLDTFGELFAPGLREAALRVVADHLPPMSEFMGFQGVLDWYSALNVPLKNLILQNFQAVAQSRVFADTPQQTLDWNRTVRQPVTVLNLSALQEPWRGLFFREAMQALLRQSGEEVVPVLLYPENYLPNLAQWIHKADEAEFKLLMLASPYVSDALLAMANNRFWTETPEQVSLVGSLTLGLPLVLPVPGTLEHAGSTDLLRPSEHVEPQVEDFPEFQNHPAIPALALQQAVGPDNANRIESAEPLPTSVLSEPGEGPVHWLGETSGPTEQIAGEDAIAPEALADSFDNEPQQADMGVFTSQVMAPQQPDLMSPSQEALGKVVDLSAPPPQAAPEFLTASQLSQLLGSGANLPAETNTLRREAEAPMPRTIIGLPEADGSIAQPGTVLSPDAIPLAMAQNEAAVPSLGSPANELTQWTPEPSASTISGDGAFGISDDTEAGYAGDFADSAFQGMAQNLAAEAEQPILPPFPAPEEYEREEFHFDLNPDEQDTSLSASNHVAARGGAVSQSLDDFAAFDIPVEPFQGGGAIDSSAAPEPFYEPNFGMGEQPRPVPTPPDGADILAGLGQTDQEMNDALDLIFPNYNELAATEASPAEVAGLSAPLLDEPIAIVQKPVEPSVSDVDAFQPGDRINHPTYGVGVVQKVIPMEESVVLNINFDTVGKRLLDPALCLLTRA